MTSRKISAKSPTIFIQSMMHDGIRLVSIKGTALWHFEDMGQTCTLTSCRAHVLSSGKAASVGNWTKP